MEKFDARAVVPKGMFKRVCDAYLIDPDGEHCPVVVLRSALKPFGAAAILVGDQPGRLYWPRAALPGDHFNNPATTFAPPVHDAVTQMAGCQREWHTRDL